ncbi:uncharacterized protein LOC134744912 [Cydia strobilella]|uniref:uncharacterized protein LOC134744912 n=1 Tax=Cydia strobilella TaxID=1100964 RepID=UPI00300581B8
MDDYIQSLPDESTATDMVRDIINIHKEGGFEIRNFTSNNLDVLKSVPTEALGDAAVKFKIGQQYAGERTLGLIWYPGTDGLGFDVSLKRVPLDVLKGEQRPTKRLMLKVIMSIFDVFGFLAPFTIQGKIMLQDTWKSHVGWDDTIPDATFDKWRKWLELLQVINKIRVPRCYHQAGSLAMQRELAATNAAPSPLSEPSASAAATSCEYNNLQLHTFCDASTKAMAAVSYWRWNDKFGNICVALVASKCRVCPVKALTVPRYELQSALLAARLADTLLKEHKLKATRRYFWSDATTVLHWIKNDTRNYKTFVANRLGEIDELTRASEWRYVSTKLNIADTATREVYDETIFQNEWFNGPTFLYGEESTWPQDLVEQDVNVSNLERVTLVQEPAQNSPLPDPHRFSSWLRLKRATAAVLKFVNKWKKLTSEEDCETMERAERLILKQSQRESFGQDIVAIKADEFDVLRCGGRIDAALDVAHDVKRPIILDGKHQVARLLAKHYHEKAAHDQQETVVNDLKQKYWIVKLRSTVKFVASRCMICKLRKAKPEVPRMGDLPAARMAHHQRPFTYSGCDLFGPIEVTVGRHRENRYGVLFTCLTVRAVHIEIVHSLTTDSMIMALRRMAARRGWPRYLYSDNGTNLRGADSELKKAVQELDDEVLKREAANEGIQWSFIPPASPHWGGAWERLVRSVKTSLKVIFKERAPKDETLSTFIAEVENIVNCRPLTHVSVEPGSDEALTPNHFLLGTSSSLPVLGCFDVNDLHLRKQWRKSQLLADMFWQRWVREY